MRSIVSRNNLSPTVAFAGLLAGGFLMNNVAEAVARRGIAGDHATDRGRQISSAFQPFAPKVKTRSDDKNFYVESDGMPNHKLMVGITNWQQQVPIPQKYTGSNAWQFPLKPVPAANPMSAKNHFFRGAMAIAADGVPIFNALNNRGEISQDIGELDEFGGHCGRADDYHYHIVPTYVEKIAPKGQPVAYSLDGYPLYGYTEPDGAPVGKLDEFGGHDTVKWGYHYHAQKSYPYLNGGFHGEVVERDGQVDPQPSAQPFRQALTPLRGAKITGFEQPKPGVYSLTCTYNGAICHVNYVLQRDGSYKFDYIDGQGKTVTETYQARQGGGAGRRGPAPDGAGGAGQGGSSGGSGGPGGGQGGRGTGAVDQGRRGPVAEKETPIAIEPKDKSGNLKLTSPAVGADQLLPIEFTGDGASISPPLAWSGAPKGTACYALSMHHVDPQGLTKWYWTVYNIPATVTSLPKDVHGVGITGNNSVSRNVGYAPPHSKGPGAKTYTVTLYALSRAPKIIEQPYAVSRKVLLNAIKDDVLAIAEMKITYTSKPE